MRRQSFVLMMLLTVGVTATAWAQLAITVRPPFAPTASGALMTPDLVVARLMSFDTNHDGKVARSELPERMQHLLTRGTVGDDGVLDPIEVRSLAAAPPPVVNARGIQPGRYGFGDGFGFDTKLHIEGAIDDLRLAGDARQKAFEVAKAFQDSRIARAKEDLMATMTKVLTADQLADFTRAVESQTMSVPAVQVGDVMFFGATPHESAGQPLVRARVRSVAFDPSRTIQNYELAPAAKKQALEAAERYQERMLGRLLDEDRQALVAQLHGVLDAQQRDDLRAALERRPLVKQGPTTVAVTFPPQTNPEFRIQNLLLVR
jgi:hypothetical protein